MMIKYSKRIAIIFIFVVAYAFQLPDSIDQSKIPTLVKSKLDAEIKKYYDDRLRHCKLEALLKAEDYVDSIFINRADHEILKGLKFPVRPPRPEFPKEIKLNDTTVIKPLIVK